MPAFSIFAQWYKLENSELRGYKLLLEKKLLLVNTMVRLTDLKFTRGRGGPQQRELRSGGMEFLSDDYHYSILDNM